jgi:Protein of unknown function (DUF2442)
MSGRVTRVIPLPKYRLWIEFDDGVSGTIDLAEELAGEVFEPLRDEAIFRQVAVDEYGAVCWPDGPDLAPDAMYDEIASRSKSRSPSEEELHSSAVPQRKPTRP